MEETHSPLYASLNMMQGPMPMVKNVEFIHNLNIVLFEF